MMKFICAISGTGAFSVFYASPFHLERLIAIKAGIRMNLGAGTL
jgi:hypothetical protein